MSHSLATRLDRAVEALPRAYPGPGGAVAVLRDGETLVRHAWGWANAERRIPFTPRTLFRMCSITKQFTCGVVLDAFPDPSVLDGDVRARLPRLEQPAPGALHLCHNQSGLRDYWAVAMLHGSPVEAPFGDKRRARVIAGTRTLQFAPGTRHSYVNQNFRILADIIQERTGRGFAELLRSGIFERAGMATAFLAADTSAMPDGTQGYEGTPTGGFRAAENRILWTGDAGLGASLDDMIAWERHIDATRDDADALYSRMSAPVSFSDGTPAVYGFGLNRGTELGRQVTAHGGALRGWRSHRMYVPSERVSIVVMFNHLSNAHDAAVDVLAAVLGEERPPPTVAPPPDWLGAYTEPETGLSVRIDAADGQVRLRYGHFPDAARPAGRRHGQQRQRQRATSARRRRAMDGPPAREPKLAPASVRRRAGQGRHRPLPLRGAGCRTGRGRCRWRALRRLLGLSGPGTHGTSRPGRSRCLGAALPACAGPHAAGRLDAGVPARHIGCGFWRRGRLLARPPPELRTRRLT